MIYYYMKLKMLEGYTPDLYRASTIQNLYVRPPTKWRLNLEDPDFVEKVTKHARTVPTLD